MNNLILVRHGQSKWNYEKRFTGWADIDLTEKGKLEAKNAGELINKLNITFHKYFSSNLKRATNTIEIILKTLDIKNTKIIKSNALNERHYGELTSLNKDEIMSKYGEKQVQIWRRSFDIPPPPMKPDHPYKNKIDPSVLSESLKDTFKRVIPYYENKIKPPINSKENVLIVLHGNSCRALLMELFNISKEKIIELEIPTGNPLLVRFDDNIQIKDYRYLDEKRAKKILFNV